MSRPLLRPQVVATDLDMHVDRLCAPTNINMISAIGYTVVWTDGSLGAFSVEVSNDYVPDPPGVTPSEVQSGNWVAIELSNDVESDGTAGSAYIDVVGISAAWIRLRWTRDSGIGGTFSATLAGKVQ